MSSNPDLVLTENRKLTWSHRKVLPFILIIVAAFGISLWLWQQQTEVNTSAVNAKVVAPDIQGSIYQQAKPIADFRLTDANGEAFTVDDLKGRWSILFFGFTSCPHICPANMLQLTRVYVDLQQSQTAGMNDELPQVVFVSVDPQTDKQHRLKEFIGHFDSSFQAIGGSDEQLAPLEQSLDISHQAGKPKPSGFYFVDHSNLLHLIDPEGRVVADFAPPFTQNGLRDDYLSAVRYLKTRL